jgi:hypothetical protein
MFGARLSHTLPLHHGANTHARAAHPRLPCRRIRQALQLEVAPPSLEAAVVYAASELLPRYLPGLDSSTPLRGQPLARSALQVRARGVLAARAASGRCMRGGGRRDTRSPCTLCAPPCLPAQVCRLVVDAGAAEGRSPWLAAGARQGRGGA